MLSILGLISPRIWLYLAVFTVISGGLIWIRADARNDVIRDLQNKGNEAQLEHIENGGDTFDDIQDFSGDEFVNAIDRLPGSDPTD